MTANSILIIHPKDKTTSFLDRIKNYLITNFNDKAHHFNIYPNDKSHSDCLERISTHPADGLIIFLGHGRSDRLYGSKGDLYESLEFVSPEAINEDPSNFYYNDNFINETNIDIFKGKKIFCLSCNSKDKIGQLAIDKGTKSFFGFGDSPTSIAEFNQSGEDVGNNFIASIKNEINYIIKISLTYSITNNYSFQELLNILRFITNQRLSDTLMSAKKIKKRHLLADFLYYLKSDASIIGERNIKLLE
jgi:hypothetical protein